MKIALVPPENVDETLDEVGPILIRATDRSGGRWSLPDVLDLIDTGAQHLWIAFDGTRIWGVVTTKFEDYAKTRRMAIVFCAGDQLKDWMRPMLDTLYRWAADNNCDGVEFTGRSGWARVLREEGFVQSYVVMEKKILAQT